MRKICAMCMLIMHRLSIRLIKLEAINKKNLVSFVYLFSTAIVPDRLNGFERNCAKHAWAAC
jgi:hypothetical protein